MDPYIIRERVDLARPGSLKHWPDMMMIEDDAKAHCWEVSVYRDGVPVDMSGCKVIGWFTRKDTVVVPIDGVIEGNVIRVTLNAACYAVHGDLYALLRATVGDTTITLARVRYYVSLGVSDNIYDPTGIFPTVPELLARIKELEQATTAANQAAARANAAAENAESFDRSGLADGMTYDQNTGNLQLTSGGQPIQGGKVTIKLTDTYTKQEVDSMMAEFEQNLGNLDI